MDGMLLNAAGLRVDYIMPTNHHLDAIRQLLMIQLQIRYAIAQSQWCNGVQIVSGNFENGCHTPKLKRYKCVCFCVWRVGCYCNCSVLVLIPLLTIASDIFSRFYCCQYINIFPAWIFFRCTATLYSPISMCDNSSMALLKRETQYFESRTVGGFHLCVVSVRHMQYLNCWFIAIKTFLVAFR